MLLDELLSRRLVVLTGKGGVGKSIVGTALALAAHERGKRVLLVEVAAPVEASRLLGGRASQGREVEVLPGALHAEPPATRRDGRVRAARREARPPRPPHPREPRLPPLLRGRARPQGADDARQGDGDGGGARAALGQAGLGPRRPRRARDRPRPRVPEGAARGRRARCRSGRSATTRAACSRCCATAAGPRSSWSRSPRRWPSSRRFSSATWRARSWASSRRRSS